MISDQAAQFEAEMRAVYERHKAVGFFSYMTDNDGKVCGQLRAHPTDRAGVLYQTQDICTQLMGRFARGPVRASAAETGGLPRCMGPRLLGAPEGSPVDS